jgi:plastocyanin
VIATVEDIMMMFSFASMLSTLVLALQITSVLANPLSSNIDETAELEERGNWYYPKAHRVIVGAWGKFKYHPEYVNAEVGDYIKFELYVLYHFRLHLGR